MDGPNWQQVKMQDLTPRRRDRRSASCGDDRSLSDLGATTPMSLLKAKPLLVGKCLIKIENIGF